MKKVNHAEQVAKKTEVKSEQTGLSRSAMVLGLMPHLLLTPSLGAAAETEGGIQNAIEEIVVTARFREEKLQDIPDTVKVFSAGDIREARIVSISDVSALVPNFSMFSSQDAGLAAVNIRGIGQVRNGEPPLAVVIDGVQVSHPDQIRQPLFDIASIEVLKGPRERYMVGMP
ncbi:TonB-dependent receptor plug domain-containing protein [Kineobactrum salinum]|uniref:Plug domain-containing protein n=1 Tax=Kineobactrum salinum TaxID=2708301 RepID=A0A6C0U2W3_9GAMM|nr:Plug domain-containing protein [Kineobactrum salinum]QIB65779.1 Plug domain-containing protein [Kineobactrum salinum]